MRRPSFQFYPADWTANGNLRRCTHAEKGIWIDVMCVLHDQEEYGLVRWSLKEIAQAVNCPVSALLGLVEKGILKGADAGYHVDAFVYVPRTGRRNGTPVELIAAQPGPLWYSSRMVRDEYVRRVRAESALPDAPDDTLEPSPNPAPKPPIGVCSIDCSSSSTSSTASSTKPKPLRFESSPEQLLKPREKSASRGARLPDAWALPDEWARWATHECGFSPSLVRVTGEKFADYWHAKAGADACKRDWFATWRNWCRRDQEHAARAPPRAGGTREGSTLWSLDHGALNALARELGIGEARAGESAQAFIARIQAAQARRH